MSRCITCKIHCDSNTQYQCKNCGRLFWNSEEAFEESNKKRSGEEAEKKAGPIYKPIDVSSFSAEEDWLESFYSHAAMSLLEGNAKVTIVYDFMKYGLPKGAAEIVVNKANEHKKNAFRKNGRWEIISGFGFLLFGGIITAISYSTSTPGQEFTVALGALFVGVITITHGVYRSIMG